MRPLLLAALLAVPFLHGCAATCSTEGLSASLAALPDPSPDATAAMLAGACKTDEAYGAWLAAPNTPSPEAWKAACPGDVDVASLDQAPRIAHRAAAFEACKVAETGIADEATFIAAGGHPALALATFRQLAADPKVDETTARSVAQSLLGEPDLTPLPVQVPTLAVESADAVTDPGPADIVVEATGATWGEVTVSFDDISALAPHGDDGRAIAALAGAASTAGDEPVVVAAAADVPASLLERVVASTGKEAVTLQVLATLDGKPHAPHGLTLRLSAPDGPALRLGPGPKLTPYEGRVAKDPVDAVPDGDFAQQLPPGATAAQVVERARGGVFTFDTGVDACLTPPTGMVCIPGGPTAVGTAEHHPGDGPTTVHESTFYADIAEASNADYRACMEAGACPDKTLSGGDALPVTGLSFIEARFLCTYEGKRLPSQWEWERMATPPGESVDTCEVVNHAGCGGDPRAVTEGTPNGWGLLNVLGNASEATSSYPKIGRETCGEACEGWDPLGFCDAAPYCKGRLTRVIKGGSASDPASKATPAWRDIVRKKRSTAGLGVRCVSDSPILHTFPPAYVQSPPPPPEAPGALTPEQLAVLDAIEEDRIDEIPECSDGKRGSSQVDCKDPTHYIYPNEDRGFITYPYIENRGGALLGVGSDQNYTFAAIARSELVFLLDYDAIVVHIHRVNQAFIKHEDTPDGFVERWNPENRAESLEIIAKEWEGDPMASVYQRTLRSLNNIMYRHYKRTRAPSESGSTSWLRDEAKYAYVKDLWEKGRVRTLKGDMLGPNAMTGVGKALHELNVPMRIYYTSNAPNAWGGHMTPEYKRNSLSFPMDERSIVLQALGWTNEFGQQGHWHFNVQDGPEFQRKLALDGYAKLWQITRPYRSTDDIDLTLTDLEGTWEDAHAE